MRPHVSREDQWYHVAHVRIAANSHFCRTASATVPESKRRWRRSEISTPLISSLHLLRVGRLKVPPREVSALLRDAAFLQVCSACTMALNTREKKRDADVPLFCACLVADADVLFPERWPGLRAWRQGAGEGVQVREAARRRAVVLRVPAGTRVIDSSSSAR